MSVDGAPVIRLVTIGQATMVVIEDDRVLLATDPWLVGRAYWGSWCLDRYPSDADRALVAAAEHVYLTHGHPDHFHHESLRLVAPDHALHPMFPNESIPTALGELGITACALEPGVWFHLSDAVRISSIPVPLDDSILIVDTPHATIVNVNDSVPSTALLRVIRRRYVGPTKRVVLLKSHSPASVGSCIYRDGTRTPISAPRDYAERIHKVAAALSAHTVVSFASQIYFDRDDSRWANDHRVRWDEIRRLSGDPVIAPYVDMDLETLENASVDGDLVAGAASRPGYVPVDAAARPEELVGRLEAYLAALPLLSLVMPHGIGWELTMSGTTWRYDSRSKRVTQGLGRATDMVVRVADDAVERALSGGRFADLGLAMVTRIESNVDERRPYLFFFLGQLHDEGYLDSPLRLARTVWYYARFAVPALNRLWWTKASQTRALPRGSLAPTD